MIKTREEIAKSNSVARDQILASIRSGLLASAPYDAARRAYRFEARPMAATSKTPVSIEELTELFRANLESVGGICSIVGDESEATAVVVEIIKQSGAKKIAISDSDIVRRLVDSNPPNQISQNVAPEALFDYDLGITSAQWAIAETGTLVLESEKEKHRLTSLVPPVHLCILNASTIRHTLSQILELTRRDLSRTITLITGASRTSDIELTLAIGVHGPGEIHVIVLKDR